MGKISSLTRIQENVYMSTSTASLTRSAHITFKCVISIVIIVIEGTGEKKVLWL